KPDLDVAEADGAGRRRRRADAGPGVEADVVVIAAGGDEPCARAEALGQLEAEHVDVEPFGFRQLRNLQVDVADHRPRWETGTCLEWQRAGLGEEIVEVERIGPHPQLAIDERPLTAGSITIDFDAVAVPRPQAPRFAEARIR